MGRTNHNTAHRIEALFAASCVKSQFVPNQIGPLLSRAPVRSNLFLRLELSESRWFVLIAREDGVESLDSNDLIFHDEQKK